MRPDDLKYLESALNSFILAGFNRVASTDVRQHHFRITAADMGRQRVHDGFVEEVREFFEAVNANVTFDSQRAAFVVHIDLDTVLLNPSQANSFAVACQAYRDEDRG